MVLPKHLNHVYVRTLTRPLQNIFLIFEPIRGGLVGVFQIIVLLPNPSNDGLTFQDFLVRSRIHGSISYNKSSRA